MHCTDNTIRYPNMGPVYKDPLLCKHLLGRIPNPQPPQRPHRAADTPGPRSDAPSSAAPPVIHTKTRHTTARRPVPDQHHIIRKHPAHVHDQTAARRLPVHTPSSHAPRNGQPRPRWKPCSTPTQHKSPPDFHAGQAFCFA